MCNMKMRAIDSIANIEDRIGIKAKAVWYAWQLPTGSQ